MAKGSDIQTSYMKLKKKDIIKKNVFEREIGLCQLLSKQNNGKCNWGLCKYCGVLPLLYKLHKSILLEKPRDITKIKKILIKTSVNHKH